MNFETPSVCSNVPQSCHLPVSTNIHARVLCGAVPDSTSFTMSNPSYGPVDNFSPLGDDDTVYRGPTNHSDPAFQENPFYDPEHGDMGTSGIEMQEDVTHRLKPEASMNTLNSSTLFPSRAQTRKHNLRDERALLMLCQTWKQFLTTITLLFPSSTIPITHMFHWRITADGNSVPSWLEALPGG